MRNIFSEREELFYYALQQGGENTILNVLELLQKSSLPLRRQLDPTMILSETVTYPTINPNIDIVYMNNMQNLDELPIIAINIKEIK